MITRKNLKPNLLRQILARVGPHAKRQKQRHHKHKKLEATEAHLFGLKLDECHVFQTSYLEAT